MTASTRVADQIQILSFKARCGMHNASLSVCSSVIAEADRNGRSPLLLAEMVPEDLTLPGRDRDPHPGFQ